MDSEESQSADASGGETVESAVDEVLNAYQEEVSQYISFSALSVLIFSFVCCWIVAGHPLSVR